MKANRLAPCSWNKKKGKSPLEKGKPFLELPFNLDLYCFDYQYLAMLNAIVKFS